MTTTQAGHNGVIAPCHREYCGPQSMQTWSVLLGQSSSTIARLPELEQGESGQPTDVKDFFSFGTHLAQCILRSRPTPIVRWHVDTLIWSPTIIPANPTGYPSLLQRLAELRELDADWDGTGAVAPRHESITGAVLFTDILMKLDGIIAPKAMPLSTGNISLYWRSSDWYIEVEFIDTQTYDYYAEDFSGTHSFGCTSTIFPVDLNLLKVIEQFSRQS